MIPRVYSAISAITATFARHGLAKERVNLEDDYAYRSIDDVLIRLAPLLAEHRLCVLPRVLERTSSEHTGLAGERLTSVALKVAYDLVSSEDGSTHTIESYGEALDHSDKATAKALQSAYKYAVLQAFAVPVTGSEDADARSPRLKTPQVPAEPVQGWEQWCDDIAEMIAACETSEALRRVQDTHRAMLAALQRERAQLYTQVGQAIAGRRAALAQSARDPRGSGAAELVQSARDGAKATAADLTQSAPDAAADKQADLKQFAGDETHPTDIDLTQSAPERAPPGNSQPRAERRAGKRRPARAREVVHA